MSPRPGGDVAAHVIFLGYRVKKRWRPEARWDPQNTTGVIEVCSVSDCIAAPPDDWVQRWDFNRATCYDTPQAAEATIPPCERTSYRLFAYWLVLDGGEVADAIVEKAFVTGLPPLPGTLGPSDWELLGFDVVGLSNKVLGFEHSPLSCNGLVQSEQVNRFCLVDDRERALALASRFSIPGAGHEPDRYYAVLVARRSEADG